MEGIVQHSIMPKTEDAFARPVVRRGQVEIKLIQGEITIDPENEAELINLLDHFLETATMGALLPLYDDENTVMGVFRDKVSVRHYDTEKVYEIVGLAAGGSMKSLRRV